MKLASLVGAGCLAAALSVAGTVARADAAGAFSHVVVFGDSLSDQGNAEMKFGYPPLPPYASGRFSDGYNWIDILSQQLGVKIKNSLANGTNYAFAFGTTGSQNTPPPIPFKTETLAQQEQLYLQHVKKADPDALYVIEGGGTDILGLLFGVENDPLLLLEIPSMDATGAQNIATEAQLLLQNGAKHVLVSNVPDLSLLPIVTEQSGLGGIIAPSVAQNAAQLWDEDLANDVLPLTKGKKVILWDFYNTSSLVLAAAAQLGITNTTTECVEGYGTTLGVQDQCTPQVEATHAFFDQVHFTTAGYFGMEQGAYCALGYSTLFKWKHSQCIVTANNPFVDAAGHPVTAATFGAWYRSALQNRATAH
jgi:outer membrane lipase/esterase